MNSESGREPLVETRRPPLPPCKRPPVRSTREAVKEEPPANSPRLRRLRSPLWWILALFLSFTGYYTWREYDYQQAISEAKEAGF